MYNIIIIIIIIIVVAVVVIFLLLLLILTNILFFFFLILEKSGRLSLLKTMPWSEEKKQQLKRLSPGITQALMSQMYPRMKMAATSVDT